MVIIAVFLFFVTTALLFWRSWCKKYDKKWENLATALSILSSIITILAAILSLGAGSGQTINAGDNAIIVSNDLHGDITINH